MKVFLSWSGDLSLKAACAFRDWLPSVIQSVKPYVSSEDIDKGARWSTDIAEELEESSFGVICVTQDNMEAPWVNFEAGALSKTFGKSRVVPFLFNVKRSELQGPLLQFQSAIYEKDDIHKLVMSLNGSLPDTEQLEEARLAKVFEVWWPELKRQLDSLPREQAGQTEGETESQPGPSNAILEELLELARNQQKLLRSPSEVLPAPYLAEVIRESIPGGLSADKGIADAIRYASRYLSRLEDTMAELRENDDLVLLPDVVDNMEASAHSVRDALNWTLERIMPKRRPSGRT